MMKAVVSGGEVGLKAALPQLRSPMWFLPGQLAIAVTLLTGR